MRETQGGKGKGWTRGNGKEMDGKEKRKKMDGKRKGWTRLWRSECASEEREGWRGERGGTSERKLERNCCWASRMDETVVEGKGGKRRVVRKTCDYRNKDKTKGMIHIRRILANNKKKKKKKKKNRVYKHLTRSSRKKIKTDTEQQER